MVQTEFKEVKPDILEREVETSEGIKRVRIFLSKKMLKELESDAVKQLINTASLPGVYSPACAMPDIHVGYGFPIGGVAAIDAENGCISPGGVGFDINCGVRLLTVPLTKDEAAPKIKELLDELFKNVPCGVGSESKCKLTREELDEVLTYGAEWCLKKGYAYHDDLDSTESNGRLEDADPLKVSQRAKKRGKSQLGTLGAGNHFLEIQIVDEIFDETAAKTMGLKKGNITVMIHCGSRGLGHQVCSDFIRRMEEETPEIANSLVDRNLIYAKTGSPIAKDYFKAMCASANFAWANRQMIVNGVRKSFKRVYNLAEEDIKQVYDVAHNIAKLEEYEFDGEKRKVFVHRKGATRAFPPKHPEIPQKYQKIGQPILIPGSMGTSSWVMVGQEGSMKESFGSTPHGAGRCMSRTAAKRELNADIIQKELENRNIYIKAASKKGIVEEAPQAYKDVDQVIEVAHIVGIGKKVARLIPMGVVKG